MSKRGGWNGNEATRTERTTEMFEKLPRARPRVMMHWDDAGHDGNGPIGNFRCAHCGHRAGWLRATESEMRRGVPCPVCNAEPQSEPTK